MDVVQLKTVIMAGGKGTRIASVASDIPKPMIPLQGKPILEHQIECLKRYGLGDIVIILGHLGHIIRDHFGDGSRFGCGIRYYQESSPLGTAGALFEIEPELTEDFVLLNGDIIFDIDFTRLVNFHKNSNSDATVVAHPNNHPFDSTLLVTDDEDRVVDLLNKEEPERYYKNLVNSGIQLINKRLLSSYRGLSSIPVNASPGRTDLDRDILKKTIPVNRVYAYRTPEYIKDMGTPDRYRQAASDIKNGLVSRRNLSLPQKAVFLDRDGTINRLNGFIARPEQFELLDGVAEAIRGLNGSGFLVIVISNQPVIARGEASFEDLRLIHNKMETELGKRGAFIDDIFFCPHHPDKGFPGERAELKIDCECRKPKPGLILKAAARYNIDPAESFMVGDSLTDVRAGNLAGCRSVLLSEKPDKAIEFSSPTLLDFFESFVSPK
ncbi:MAG: HAD-IIIA family hydrolase [Treponema sp.]|jgi:D-glycero-D-manno-heptose 1,7-bisphosphate phosphatase|nr:HAD-IIIA family hydrolase [Treponema sp.]